MSDKTAANLPQPPGGGTAVTGKKTSTAQNPAQNPAHTSPADKLFFASHAELAEFLRERAGELPAMSTLPQPEQFASMRTAAAAAAAAVKSRQRIAIVGDYDVDGVVATAILSEFFAAINFAVLTRIPNRFADGYGISAAMVSELAAAGAQLIITVDNGIVAHEAAARARELGVALIITDHHEPGEQLPDALAVIDPKRADCGFIKRAGVEVCGAQVAWWFAAAIKRELGANVDMAAFLPLLALAITADVMPMKGINRSLVVAGLRALNASRSCAFVALKERFGREKFTYEDLSYAICPLLNSSGRMADAALSLDFLRAATLADARALLDKLCELNALRKATEAQIFAAASEQIRADSRVIVAAAPGWHRGVIGIVAGRLAAACERPAVVCSIEDGRALGSARGVAGFDLLAMFEHASAHMLGFGGHKIACGLSLAEQNLAEFTAACEDYAEKFYQRQNSSNFHENEIFDKNDQNFHFHANFAAANAANNQISRQVAAEFLQPGCYEFCLSLCDEKSLKILQDFEPYGAGCERPNFIAIARCCGVKILKEKHLKMQLEDAQMPICSANYARKSTRKIDAIFFNYKGDLPAEGALVAVKFSLSANNFYTPARAQLIISRLKIL